MIVELLSTTLEPEPSVEEIAALLRQPIGDVAVVIRQIEETKVLDGNSRFAREINFNDEPPPLDEALLTTLNNSFEHECLEEAVALLGATSRPDAPAVQIRGTKYLLEPFPSVTFLAHQIWAIWFIVRCWVFDVDLPRVLLADKMGLGKTFTVLAAALYDKVVSNELMSNKEYKLPFLFGRTLPQWRQEVEQGLPGLSLVHRGWYPSIHARPLPRRLFQLFDNDKPSDIAPWQPVLYVVLPRIREIFVAVTKTIMAGTSFTIRNLSAEVGAEMSHTHLNLSVKFPERMWYIHVITYNALTERG